MWHYRRAALCIRRLTNGTLLPTLATLDWWCFSLWHRTLYQVTNSSNWMAHLTHEVWSPCASHGDISLSALKTASCCSPLSMLIKPYSSGVPIYGVNAHCGTFHLARSTVWLLLWAWRVFDSDHCFVRFIFGLSLRRPKRISMRFLHLLPTFRKTDRYI